ncbi:MAG: hypothetical protein MZU95_04660 [Desulfomicrobium escambiense]|nr:hypothetical protein [Desulfomicrobium escambiense]
MRVLTFLGPPARLAGAGALVGRRGGLGGARRRCFALGAARPQAPARLPQRREHRDHRARPRAWGCWAAPRARRRSALLGYAGGAAARASTTPSSRGCSSSGRARSLHATGTRDIDRLGGLIDAHADDRRGFPGRLGRAISRPAAAERLRERVARSTSAAFGWRAAPPGADALPAPAIVAIRRSR